MALYEYYKLRATGNLNFYPGQVQNIEFIDGVTPFISFTLLAQNTASVAVTINSIAGNVFANDTLIGNAFMAEPFQVPANGQAQTVVTAQLGLVAIVNDLIRAFQYKNFQEKIRFSGTGNVGGAQVPLDLQFTIGA